LLALRFHQIVDIVSVEKQILDRQTFWTPPFWTISKLKLARTPISKIGLQIEIRKPVLENARAGWIWTREFLGRTLDRRRSRVWSGESELR
jgi:hypothetical protein